jgi:hypothetical protein
VPSGDSVLCFPVTAEHDVFLGDPGPHPVPAQGHRHGRLADDPAVHGGRRHGQVLGGGRRGPAGDGAAGAGCSQVTSTPGGASRACRSSASGSSTRACPVASRGSEASTPAIAPGRGGARGAVLGGAVEDEVDVELRSVGAAGPVGAKRVVAQHRPARLGDGQVLGVRRRLELVRQPFEGSSGHRDEQPEPLVEPHRRERADVALPDRHEEESPVSETASRGSRSTRAAAHRVRTPNAAGPRSPPRTAAAGRSSSPRRPARPPRSPGPGPS